MILTIGITTYSEEVFLEELLYVIRNEIKLNQLENQVEVIITNDCGKNERTKEIIRANQDFSTSILFDKNSATPAVGRNEIINRAQGKYVLFMDGDDNFAAPLSELVEELLGLEEKDVLVSSVQKITTDGQITSSPFIYDEYLFSCSDEEFMQNHHKLVVHQTGIWTIYRAQFLRENNLYYNPEKRYEDNLFMTDLALFPTTRYGRVFTKYYGWRTNLESFSNADINYVIESRINLYQETLNKIAENPDNKFSPYLLFSVWNQTYTNLMRNYPKTTPEQYKLFFDELNKITNANKKLIKQQMKKAKNFVDCYFKLRKYRFTDQFMIISIGQKLHKLLSARVEVKKKMLSIFTLLPLNKKKIFLTSQYGKYNDNSKYLYLEMKADTKYQDYRFVFAVKDQELAKAKDFINYDNKLLYYYHHYTAKHIYFNTWYDPLFVKRKNQIWTQLWHGIPYKKVYKDIETYEQTTPEVKTIAKEKSIANWDYVWSVNSYNTKIFKRLFPNTKIIEQEYPKTAWLIKNQNNDKLIKSLREKFELQQQEKYVLYAPTYRPYDFKINIKEVEKLVPQGHKLIIHPHPMLKINNLNSKHQILNDVSDIQEVILATDAVITDYSSIQYDYQQINRQVILYKPDEELYKKIHGLY